VSREESPPGRGRSRSSPISDVDVATAPRTAEHDRSRSMNPRRATAPRRERSSPSPPSRDRARVDDGVRERRRRRVTPQPAVVRISLRQHHDSPPPHQRCCVADSHSNLHPSDRSRAPVPALEHADTRSTPTRPELEPPGHILSDLPGCEASDEIANWAPASRTSARTSGTIGARRTVFRSPRSDTSTASRFGESLDRVFEYNPRVASAPPLAPQIPKP